MSYKSELRAVHGGRAPYIISNRPEILDFSASVNPFPPQIDLRIPLDALCRYPDDEYSELKHVIARYHGCEPDNITVGNGSVEVIRTLCHTILKSGQKYFVPPHTFAEYELSARLAGAIPVSDENLADIIFICNPDNPSGRLLTKNEIRKKCYLPAKEGRIICIDEAFIDLADPSQSVTGLQIPGLFILRSLTKSFAVPGVRFGYGIGDPELIAAMEVMRPPWTVNALAESVVLSAFTHYEELERSRELIQIEKNRLLNAITNMGWICESGSANYLLIDTGQDARIVTELFLQNDILVRDCSSFQLPTSIRIAVRKSEENTRFIEVLESVRSCMH